MLGFVERRSDMAMDASRLSAAIVDACVASNLMKKDGGHLEALANAIATSVISEITTFGEIPVVPPATILPGTVSVGAGPAAAPSPAPIPTLQPPIPPGSIK